MIAQFHKFQTSQVANWPTEYQGQTIAKMFDAWGSMNVTSDWVRNYLIPVTIFYDKLELKVKISNITDNMKIEGD